MSSINCDAMDAASAPSNPSLGTEEKRLNTNVIDPWLNDNFCGEWRGQEGRGNLRVITLLPAQSFYHHVERHVSGCPAVYHAYYTPTDNNTCTQKHTSVSVHDYSDHGTRMRHPPALRRAAQHHLRSFHSSREIWRCHHPRVRARSAQRLEANGALHAACAPGPR